MQKLRHLEQKQKQYKNNQDPSKITEISKPKQAKVHHYSKQQSESPSQPIQFKITFLGNAGVGKSSLVDRFRGEAFQCHRQHTIGAMFFVKEFTLNHFLHERNKKVCNSLYTTLHIWDTAGSYKYRSLIQYYQINSQGLILVYDVSQRSSFEEIQKQWISQVKDEIPKGAKVLLIGNKADLQRQVSPEESIQLAEKYKMNFVEVSSKNGEEVEKILTNFVRQIAESKGFPIPLKDIYMSLLLFLNQDFDDDLLQDAIESLTSY